LVQGTINGQNFLITCPINIFTEVTVTKTAGESRLSGGDKICRAVESTLSYLARSEQALQVVSNSILPQGKGMASSSADISAACVATAACLGTKLTPNEIADIALAIEPTDGVFYPGIVLFDHIHGRLRRSLGYPPAMLIAIFDTGGAVDTMYFNQREDLALLNDQKEPLVREAMDLVIKGLATGECSLIGRGATLSAIANQDILLKPDLPKIIKLGEEFGAVGVSVAHSGTVLGVLFPADCQTNIVPCVQAIIDACPNVSYFDQAQLIAGGWSIVDGESNE
jgi:L-threonine kinase